MRKWNYGAVSLLALLLIACGGGEGVKPVATGAKSARINVELGVTYMNQGNNVAAMNRLQKAIAQDPGYGPAHGSMGILHARLGNNEEAESKFQLAVSLDPGNSSIRNNYGAFLCKQKKYKKAQEQFLEALKNPLYETPEYSYLNAGICSPDVIEAEKYYRAALRKNPKFPGALLQMAKLSYDLKRNLSARAYIQRLHAVSKPSAASLWVSIRVEKALGDFGLMESQSLSLKDKFPDSEETRQYLHWVNK